MLCRPMEQLNFYFFKFLDEDNRYKKIFEFFNNSF